jgi:biotin-[acetyl-CoA-carboxylase] ligase BirA-like protein
VLVRKPCAQAGAGSVCVALRGPDRHALASRDLGEGEAERILQDDHARLFLRKARETRSELVPKLREVDLSGGVGIAGYALVVEQRLAAADALAVGDIVASVDHQPVEPGRELRVAAKLAQPQAELGQCLLGCVASVFWIGEHLRGEPLDARSMPLAQRRQCRRIAVFCSLDQDRVTQPLVDERPLGPQVLTNLTALAQRRLHSRLSVWAVSDSLAPEAVLPRLRGPFGREYAYVESTPSTQLLLEPDAAEGTVAVADEQTAGRGRLGRHWLAPAGTSLLCSVQLRPKASPERLPELTGVAALACAEAIESVTGLEPELKFPNDLLLNGRKVAGILAEAREGRVVLGVGINVNVGESDLPTEVDRPATSLLVETGHEIDRAELLVELLERLERRYEAWNQGPRT